MSDTPEVREWCELTDPLEPRERCTRVEIYDVNLPCPKEYCGELVATGETDGHEHPRFRKNRHKCTRCGDLWDIEGRSYPERREWRVASRHPWREHRAAGARDYGGAVSMQDASAIGLIGLTKGIR